MYNLNLKITNDSGKVVKMLHYVFRSYGEMMKFSKYYKVYPGVVNINNNNFIADTKQSDFAKVVDLLLTRDRKIRRYASINL